MVVLAFRGTKNLKNMVTDVKVWQGVAHRHVAPAPLPSNSVRLAAPPPPSQFFRTFHEPRRRRDLSFVMVHTGFYAAWRGLGFNERVLERVAAAVEAAGAADGSGALPPRFVITGKRGGKACERTMPALLLPHRAPGPSRALPRTPRTLAGRRAGLPGCLRHPPRLPQAPHGRVYFWDAAG